MDTGLFDRHVARLTELGYATARTQLVWPLERMLLHRGDPHLTALGAEDLDELRTAIDAFTARLRPDPVREFYSRAPDGRPPAEVADGYLRSAIARLHATHVLLFDLGQLDRPPTGRVTAGSWVDRLARPGRRRTSAPSSSATCVCTWTPTWTGHRQCATPVTRCAAW